MRLFITDILKKISTNIISSRYFDYNIIANPIKIHGINFSTPVMIAAGFDKNGEYLNAIKNMGASAIEVGTITPLSQKAKNVKRHIKKLRKKQGLINAIGCKNIGAHNIRNNIDIYRKNTALDKQITIGGNIGFNNDCKFPLSDYIECAKYINPSVDYITVNLSSPNVKGMRNLQTLDFIRALLMELTDALGHKKIFIKLSPEVDIDVMKKIIKIVQYYDIAGLVLFNTHLYSDCDITGGLSGKPIFQQSLNKFKEVSHYSDGINLIASGGIFTGHDAIEYINAGAKVVQIYTAMLYRGLRAPYKIYNEMIK